jgi:ABC-type transport system involved in cytochrome bd biosynthesis fused ATPase/permease subunit
VVFSRSSSIFEAEKTFFALLEGKTTLLITHRLLGLDGVVQILVLFQGRIHEWGMTS